MCVTRNGLLWQLCENLCREFTPINEDLRTREWTQAVFNGILRTQGDLCTHFGVGEELLHRYFSRSYGGDREFLVDFLWTNFSVIQEPDCAPQGPERVFFALESEWGNEGSVPENYRQVIFDFRKLVVIRASIKVMVYGFHQERVGAVEQLESGFEAILRASAHFEPSDSYLFFGVPWDGGSSWQPRIRVAEVEGTEGREVCLVELEGAIFQMPLPE